MTVRERIWILEPLKVGVYIINILKSAPTSQKTLHYKALSLMQFRKIAFLENYKKSKRSFSEIRDVQFFF